jgi:hypothetical protein
MERVLETLKEKEFYLKFSLSKYEDMPEIQESIKKDIKAFQQTIDLIQLTIDTKKYNAKTN